jgi:hypothetical protein
MVDTPRATSVPGVPYGGDLSVRVWTEPRIVPRLQLHREWTDNIDAITSEVVRHRLWNVNEELGMTIQRTSGSPVGMFRQFCRPACAGLIENPDPYLSAIELALKEGSD